MAAVKYCKKLCATGQRRTYTAKVLVHFNLCMNFIKHAKSKLVWLALTALVYNKGSGTVHHFVHLVYIVTPSNIRNKFINVLLVNSFGGPFLYYNYITFLLNKNLHQFKCRLSSTIAQNNVFCLQQCHWSFQNAQKIYLALQFRNLS